MSEKFSSGTLNHKQTNKQTKQTNKQNGDSGQMVAKKIQNNADDMWWRINNRLLYTCACMVREGENIS